jgi:cytochrome P450
MSDAYTTRPRTTDVTMWFDPVCPFSWNTARWLVGAADTAGFDIRWEINSMAVLHEGRDLPPTQQARMSVSRQVGRLMAGIRRELGSAGLPEAYMAFGEMLFAQSTRLNDEVIDHVLATVSARDTTAAALSDTSLDPLVRRSQEAGSQALGETGDSPIVRVNSHAFFGPVLTVTEDSELSGTKIEAGDKVTLWYTSANKDEVTFTDRWTLDVRRDPNPHLGYGGSGVHFCLGANLARREITVVSDELPARFPTSPQPRNPRACCPLSCTESSGYPSHGRRPAE